MISVNIDTVKIKEAGKDIKELSFELLNLINDFYGRINNIPTKTREWVGKESVSFVQLCMSEKEEYLRFINSLKLLGESLIVYSDSLEGRVRGVENELCQK